MVITKRFTHTHTRTHTPTRKHTHTHTHTPPRAHTLTHKNRKNIAKSPLTTVHPKRRGSAKQQGFSFLHPSTTPLLQFPHPTPCRGPLPCHSPLHARHCTQPHRRPFNTYSSVLYYRFQFYPDQLVLFLKITGGASTWLAQHEFSCNQDLR